MQSEHYTKTMHNSLQCKDNSVKENEHLFYTASKMHTFTHTFLFMLCPVRNKSIIKCSVMLLS